MLVGNLSISDHYSDFLAYLGNTEEDLKLIFIYSRPLFHKVFIQAVAIRESHSMIISSFWKCYNIYYSVFGTSVLMPLTQHFNDRI